MEGLKVEKEGGIQDIIIIGDSQIITSYMVRKYEPRHPSLLMPISKSRLYCISHILTKRKFIKSNDLL